MLRFETADHELVRELARDGEVDASLPRRGAFDYLAHLGRRLAAWLMDVLWPFGRYARSVGAAVGGTVVVAALLTASLVSFLAARALLRRRRSRRAPAGPGPELLSPEPSLPSWDDARWREELRERLDRSDVAGALEALWWWLARSLAGASVHESWTSGDLLGISNRPGLRDPVRRLERMMYGSRPPSRDDVLDLLHSLERQLA